MLNTRYLLMQKRLSEAKDGLEYLDAERLRRNDPAFGRLLEDQMIWRELLELELQEAEARITSMCDAAERALDMLK